MLTADHPLFCELRNRYAEAHRHYHNQRHIDECLAEFAKVRELAEHPEEVEWAIWFHDVIYDPRASDNEASSAAFARQRLSALGIPCERIAAMIMATATHEAETRDEQLMVDCDLAILAADAADFAAYDAAIRREYAWVPEAAYRPARAAVLRRFLDRQQIYHTPYFRERYEARARANIQHAIRRLRPTK
jgi:predicted metal-dependent HD superfamily phosphohydrolase